MKKRRSLRGMLLASAISIGCGCAGMLPSPQELHPKSYNKLIAINPQCVHPDTPALGACYEAGAILDKESPEAATSEFIAYWDKYIFYYDDRLKRADEKLEITDNIVYGKVKRDTVRQFGAIVVPTLRAVYKEDNSEYSKRMLKALDQIVIDSRTSMETFREAHSRAAFN